MSFGDPDVGAFVHLGFHWAEGEVGIAELSPVEVD